MRIKLPHVPYIARKIALDILNSGLVTFSSGIDKAVAVADEILRKDVLNEKALDEEVNEILEQNIDDIDIMQVDKKSMFWLVKKRLAEDKDFTLNYEDRYSNISHQILEIMWKKSLIDYNVSENKIKNLIYKSIKNYLKTYESIEDDVIVKLDNYKRKLIPGSEEYELIFEKLYEEELKKRGMF